MKISYTVYNDSKEATYLSRYNARLCFLLGIAGVVVSILLAGNGGICILLGVLALVGTFFGIKAISKANQERINEILYITRKDQYEELRKQALTREQEDRKQLEKELIRYQYDLEIVKSKRDSLLVKEIAEKQKISPDEVIKHARSRVDSMDRRIRLYNESHIIKYPFEDEIEVVPQPKNDLAKSDVIDFSDPDAVMDSVKAQLKDMDKKYGYNSDVVK